MSNLPVDRDKSYMYKMWGTTKLITDYFKMTYSELDFVTFHVRSFIFPPEKTNEDKFFELFGKSNDL